MAGEAATRNAVRPSPGALDPQARDTLPPQIFAVRFARRTYSRHYPSRALAVFL